MKTQKGKYSPGMPFRFPTRTWPDKEVEKAPIWCSVDLRDGNQALRNPMTVEQKLEFFRLLVQVGFKEIEVGYPAASDTEHEFVRTLIEKNLIPEDVTIQVLSQTRPDLIDATINRIKGVKKVIIHLYNSTSPAQREFVFATDKEGSIKMAVTAVEHLKNKLQELPNTEVIFEYSPESFSLTEPEFAVQICNEVIACWRPTENCKMIINLPATVEVSTPNVFADQIEYFCKNVNRRNEVVISVHTHNDRGTGTAATELAMLAGAERVEGTLFGNGERTGNLDIVIAAMNLFSQGIDPQLDFSRINEIREIYEKCTGMTVYERQPYSGELVFTAFSGSHQDAIRKGIDAWEKGSMNSWLVPYVLIDPTDIGRNLRMETIRVNGQSGKSGIAFLLKRDYNIQLPKELEREFSAIAGPQIDAQKSEMTSAQLKKMLWCEYVDLTQPFSLITFSDAKNGVVKSVVTLRVNEKECVYEGRGNGSINAFVDALVSAGLVPSFSVEDYSEYALSPGTEAKAISYVLIKCNNLKLYGIGTDSNSEIAPLKAIISALNRWYFKVGAQ